MAKDNIFLGIHYPTPVHKQTVVRKMMEVSKLEITEKIVDEIISLPIYPLLKDEEAVTIAEKIKKIIEKLSK
jgi:dTDP-4-amino-4,6-dideoxygalactose transaminase